MKKTCVAILIFGLFILLSACSDTPSVQNSLPQSTAPSTTMADPTEAPSGHVHCWTEAGCIAPKACSSCGVTDGSPLGHDWKDATCSEAKTCTRCGAVDGRPNDHVWEKGETITEATEETDGEAQYVCKNCGETKTIIIPSPAHKHSYSEENQIPPTCTENGYTVYTCRCGDSYTENVQAATGHDWIGATCTTANICKSCGMTHGTALGHTWKEETCTTPKTCSVCRVTTGSAIGHEWMDATCTTPKTCGACGAVEGIARDHSWKAATCTAPKTCSTCGTIEGSPKGHDWALATCTAPKTCKACGVVEGIANDHKWDNGKIVEEATEEKDGKLLLTCTICKETKTQIIPSLSHEHKYGDVVVSPTCTTPGYTAHVCRCGDLYVTDEKDAFGHNWIAASCTTPKTCSVCGKIEGSAKGHSWSPATCTAAQKCTACGVTEGAPAGHNWRSATCTAPKTCKNCNVTTGTANGHSWKSATCTTSKTCSVCSATEGSALGHSWLNATCTTPKTCNVCGKTEGSARGHSWTPATCTTPKTCINCNITTGTANGHSWKSATCTTPKTCKNCNVTTGTANGHSWKSATCTTPKTCSVCSATEGSALEHSWLNATCTTPKTCNVCGKTEGSPEHSYVSGVCSNCGILKPSDGLQYTKLDNSYCVSGLGSCRDRNIVIPDTYNGLPVTVIGDSAFKECDFSSVTIPDSVIRIDTRAFSLCKNLKNVIMGDNVTTIGYMAFGDCTRLSTISFDGKQLLTIEDYAFAGCESLTTAILPYGVTNIGQGAFWSCKSLTNVVIPDSVTSIGDLAFTACKNLTSITIGSGVTQIDGLRQMSYVTDIHVSAQNPIYCSVDGVVYTKDMKTLVLYPVGRAKTGFSIPAGVTTIGTLAFSGDKDITSIGLAGSTAYPYIGIPTSVTCIESFAFSQCSGITHITLPSSINKIGDCAFSACENLKSITYTGTMNQWLTAVSESPFWSYNLSVTEVICSDGKISLNS